eukprot:10306392-Heterocapsa_arctica.AAC.1
MAEADSSSSPNTKPLPSSSSATGICPVASSYYNIRTHTMILHIDNSAYDSHRGRAGRLQQRVGSSKHI